MPVLLSLFQDQTFSKADIASGPLLAGEYDNCTFVQCDFSRADFSGFRFSDCEFQDCNLSNVKLLKTALQNVRFRGCKLTGVPFHTCSDLLFTVSFENCLLHLATFYKLTLKKTLFKGCTLHETDFTQATLNGSSFAECDLLNATFDQTNLEQCDFRTAYNYRINPELNRLRKARFTAQGLGGLLQHLGILID